MHHTAVASMFAAGFALILSTVQAFRVNVCLKPLYKYGKCDQNVSKIYVVLSDYIGKNKQSSFIKTFQLT